MRRKRSAIRNTPEVTQVPHAGGLLSEQEIIRESLSGNFGVLLNMLSNGQHKLVSVSPSLGAISCKVERAGQSVTLADDFDELLEALTVRIMLTGKALLLLESVTPGSSRNTLSGWSYHPITKNWFTFPPHALRRLHFQYQEELGLMDRNVNKITFRAGWQL